MKFVLLLLFLASCSSFSTSNKEFDEEDFEKAFSKYSLYKKADYIDHLKTFKKFFLQSKDIRVQRLYRKHKSYLEDIAIDIKTKNELFFDKELKTEFILINNETPFHFSLPGGIIIFSTGLVRKYIRSEKLLYCLVTYELIRSEKNIYHKVVVVPTGSMGISRIISLLRLSTTEKVELHKWAFYLLKRVGVDTDNYLSWLQIQNRNSVDFSMQLGDLNSISREESMFKAFIIKNAKQKIDTEKYASSSKSFYSFINSLKR